MAESTITAKGRTTVPAEVRALVRQARDSAGRVCDPGRHHHRSGQDQAHPRHGRNAEGPEGANGLASKR